jgi:hypothetical protein
MVGTFLFVASNILLGILSLVCFVWLFRQSRHTTAIRIIIVLLLVGVGGVVVAQIWVNQTHAASYYQWFFDMDEDRNVPSIYSAVLWLGTGILFASLGSRKAISVLEHIFWWAAALLMFFLSIDDYYAIHELLIYSWHDLYRASALVIALIGVGAFLAWLRPDFKREPTLFLMMGLGVAMLGYSGLYLERWMYATCKGPLDTVLCANPTLTTAWEEFYELLSIVIVICTLILYAKSKIDAEQWRRTLWVMGIASVFAIVAMIAYMSLLPELEQRLLAQPVDVQYGEELRLLGYWVSNPQPKPGERIYILFYWQTPERVLRDYHLSVHLLSNPALQSYAQADRVHIGQFNARAWLPNTTVRGAVHLDIPHDLPTPGSYWITVRVWSGSIWSGDADSRGLLITESNQAQMDEQTVFITRLPIISPLEAEQTVTTQSDYRFAEGFALRGYTLPQTLTTDELLEMTFQWSATQAINRQLTQFIHLVGADGTLILLDRLPFDGRILTDDWLPTLNHIDVMQQALPTDAAAGVYQVYSGMYDTQTGERIAVVDGNQQPIQDAYIHLGSITIMAP